MRYIRRTIGLILLNRLLLLLLVGILASLIAPTLSSFPYLDKITADNLPSWLYSWANFDGVHYVGIASQGYHEFDQAFFPLYPALLFLIGPLVGGYVRAGLLISLVAHVCGVYMWHAFASQQWGKRVALWSALAIIAYPTAFYFNAVYTESLFLLVSVGALYMAAKRKYMLAGMLGMLAGATRVQGALLIIPLMGLLYPVVRTSKVAWIGAIGPLVGIAGYMTYLSYTTGDALYFLTSQEYFGVQRSAEIVLLPQVLYRYAKIFLTADMSFAYGIAVLESVSFIIPFAICAYAVYTSFRQRMVFDVSLALFSCGVLVLPTLTGTFTSMPRYSLLALSMYVWFAQQKRAWWWYAAFVVSVFLQIVLAGSFIQGRFVS